MYHGLRDSSDGKYKVLKSTKSIIIKGLKSGPNQIYSNK